MKSRGYLYIRRDLLQELAHTVMEAKTCQHLPAIEPGDQWYNWFSVQMPGNLGRWWCNSSYTWELEDCWFTWTLKAQNQEGKRRWTSQLKIRKMVIEREVTLPIHLFVLLGPSVDWMMPANGEGNLLYSIYWFSVVW